MSDDVNVVASNFVRTRAYSSRLPGIFVTENDVWPISPVFNRSEPPGVVPTVSTYRIAPVTDVQTKSCDVGTLVDPFVGNTNSAARPSCVTVTVCPAIVSV